jgi:hypothetical protein
LNGGFDNLLRRLVQTGVDDLHAGITQGTGNYLRAPVMPVKSGLGHNDA